ncbi:MAG: hypothetical protein Q8898_14420, partial [Bacillota bacterium]|nr:hypothetical protein [Bacillota bacterium]
LTSPLLNDNNIEGASNILLYIASGKEEISMDEVTEITDYIQEKAGSTAEIIWGNGTDEALADKISVTLIATGFSTKPPIDDAKIIVGRLDEKPKNQPIVNEQVQETTDFKVFTKSPDGQRSDSKPVIEIVQPSTVSMNPSKTAASPTLFSLDSHSDYSQPIDIYPLSADSDDSKSSSNFTRFEHSEPATKRPLNEPTISLESIDRMANDRISRLKNLSVRAGSASIEELESQPAYMRRNVELNDAPPSDSSNISRYSLTLEPGSNQVEIRSNNTFLHDKPD